MKELEAVRFTHHAKERAQERGLVGYLTSKAVSFAIPLGNSRYRSGRCIYVIDVNKLTVVTVYPARKRDYFPS